MDFILFPAKNIINSATGIAAGNSVGVNKEHSYSYFPSMHQINLDTGFLRRFAQIFVQSRNWQIEPAR